MLATIVLPVALSALIAFFTAVAPITSAISTASSVVSTGEKVATDIKADIAKHKKKRPRRKAAPAPKSQGSP